MLVQKLTACRSLAPISKFDDPDNSRNMHKPAHLRNFSATYEKMTLNNRSSKLHVIVNNES